MTTTTKNGGPAFPGGSNVGRSYDLESDGMTLRDWFAGQALTAIAMDHGDACDGYREAISRRAYLVADAMLAERDK